MAAAPRSVRRSLRVLFRGRLVHEWRTTPHYDEPNEAWTDWARDNQWNSRVSAFVMLLAGFVFLYFMATIRSVLGGVNVSGSRF